MRRLLAALLLVLATVAVPTSVGAATVPCQGSSATVTHVMWVLEENHSEPSIIGNAQAPFINSLAAQCGLATAEHNIGHPSAPNYIGMTSGLPLAQLPNSDCTNCHQPGASIFGQVSWRAFEESMTSPCSPSAQSGGLYVPRHNPPTYFTQLLTSGACKANDLPLTALNLGSLPAFTFVTPNLNDDMHNGSIGQGDIWLRAFLGKVEASAVYQSGALVVFVVWDEGTGGVDVKGMNCVTSTSVSCHTALIEVGETVPAGARWTGNLNHYGLLATTENLLHVPLLGLAGSATPIP